MQKLLDFLYPSQCQLCDCRETLQQTGFQYNYLCEPCYNDIQHNSDACALCAIPLNTASINTSQSSANICGHCTKSPPLYDTSWSPFIYAQPLEWRIQELTFNAKLHFASLLSSLMMDNFPPHLIINKPDIIIPMPLHPQRLKQRGFNQSHLLVKPIAKHLNLSIDIKSSLRIRDTEHQTGKNARQRKQNIKNAFTFNNKKNYQHAVIFDDVITTGSSVSELTKTLKQAGIKRVDVWCLARAEKIVK